LHRNYQPKRTKILGMEIVKIRLEAAMSYIERVMSRLQQIASEEEGLAHARRRRLDQEIERLRAELNALAGAMREIEEMIAGSVARP